MGQIRGVGCRVMVSVIGGWDRRWDWVRWGVAGNGPLGIWRCKKGDREGPAGGTRTCLVDAKECGSVSREGPSMTGKCAELGPPGMSLRRPMRVENVAGETIMEKVSDNLSEL